ncbi:putative DNA-directed RNA polymerase II largest subunit [Toxoplasma gondii TgCatPRC2]|uniref:Putative DNA-directed RNA polymerase II largest subunit n=1 Tax=Toxoplasma gondii TgCatPRC2 TaxID=1130821 RepID=A0A151HG00_TOXGO|nr:putative DNA-directed RNA polymerase II largest subunit [Toxoplasma gondii TgCatPRC2]
MEETGNMNPELGPDPVDNSDDTVQRQDEVAGKDEKQAAGPALLDQNAIAADSMEGEGYRNSAAASTLDSPTLADGTRSRTEGTFEEEQENINEKNGPLLTHQEDVPSKKPTENPATTMLPDADSPAAKDVQASPQNFIWGAPDVLSSGKYHSQVHMDFINSPAMAAFSTFESLSPLYSPIEGFGMMSPSMMRDVSGTYLPPVLPSRSPYTGSPYPGVFPGGMSIDPAAGFANTNVGSLYSPNFAAAAGPIPMAGNADRTPSVSMVDNTPVGGVYSPTLRTAASAGSLDGMGLSYTGAIAGFFPDDGGPHPLNGNVGNSGDLSSPSMARGVPSMQFGGPAGIGVSLPNSFFPTTDYQHTVTNGSPGAGIVNGGFSVTPGEGTLSPKRFPSPAFSPFSLGPSTEFHGSQSRGNSGMVRETYQEINNSMQAAGAWSAWSPSRARDPFND